MEVENVEMSVEDSELRQPDHETSFMVATTMGGATCRRRPANVKKTRRVKLPEFVGFQSQTNSFCTNMFPPKHGPPTAHV